MPRVSVVIPVYNRAGLLSRPVKSVLAQTFEDWELIVVDDGSTDDSVVVAQSFDDSRIRVIALRENSGAQHARNVGIHAAEGEFIAFLDSDNEWDVDKLERQIEAFGECGAEVGVVYGDSRVVDMVTGEESRLGVSQSGDVYADLLRYFVLDFLTPLIRMKCFDKVGMLDEEITGFQEWDSFLRIARCYEFLLIPDCLATYYANAPGSISSDYNRWAGGYATTVMKHLAEMRRVIRAKDIFFHRMMISRFQYKAGNPWRSIAWGSWAVACAFFFCPGELPEVRKHLRHFTRDVFSLNPRGIQRVLVLLDGDHPELEKLIRGVVLRFHDASIILARMAGARVQQVALSGVCVELVDVPPKSGKWDVCLATCEGPNRDVLDGAIKEYGGNVVRIGKRLRLL